MIRSKAIFFIFAMCLILISTHAHAKGDGRPVIFLVGGGLTTDQMNLNLQNSNASFKGSGFRAEAGVEILLYSPVSFIVTGQFNQSSLVNYSSGKITDQSDLYAKSVKGGFKFNFLTIGAGVSQQDIKINPAAASQLTQYKYSGQTGFLFGALSVDTQNILRTQLEVQVHNGKFETLKTNYLTVGLSIIFLIPSL